jgi:beta-lactamase regulating signal transducer with metallopeptidase domain
MQSELVAAWLLTLVLHVGVLLTFAWLFDRAVLRARPAWRELLWRAALFGGVLTASAQTVLNVPTPARFALPGMGIASTSTAAADASRDTLAGREKPPVAVARSAAIASKVSASSAVTDRVSGSIGRAPQGATRSFWKPSWQLVLIAGWLAGALLALGRLLARWLRLTHVLAQARPLQNAAIAIDAAALAIQARIAVPRLVVLDELASPIAALGRRIVMPRWALDLLDREQLRAMLAHETAHLARRDPAWRLVTALWCALVWFLPLTMLARRRLDEIAELACDSWAAVHLGDGRSLAECLAECAERRIGGFDSELVAAMAHRDSPLLKRIDHLIEGVPLNTTISRTRAGVAALLALALAAVVLPGFGLPTAAAQPAASTPPTPPAPPAPPEPSAAPSAGEGHHVHVSSDISLFGFKHEFTSVEVSADGHSYRAKINGKIAFNDRDDDIASLSEGGTASFGETRSGSKRRVDYTSRGGKIEQHYFVDDREQTVDAAARSWIASIIAVVIRETAIDAEARVKRIYAKGGAAAVLDEIARIDSGYARGIYLKQLAASGKLTSAEVTRALGLIDGIDSDYERRNALAALAAAQPFDAAQQKLVVGQAAKIHSDYERAELLLGMLPTLAPDADLREAWLRAASGIHSDYEHRRTLSALLDSGHPDDATLAEIIDGAKSIGSDYERRELLVAAVKRIGDADRIAVAYTAATADIGSDYERREALLALINAPKFGANGTRAVLGVADKIGSDYECREVLIALARVMPDDADLIARYRGVARRLSDSERGAAERALDRFAG